MNALSFPTSPAPVLPTSSAYPSKAQHPIGSPLFGNQTGPTENIKDDMASTFKKMITEIKQAIGELFLAISGQFQIALKGVGQAFKVVSQGLSTNEILLKANPESSPEARTRTIGTLAYSQFHKTLIESEETPSPESQTLLFQLYDSVLQEFPGLLKTPQFPRLGDQPFIQHLIETSHHSDDTKGELYQLISNENNLNKLAQLASEQIKPIAEAFSKGEVDEANELIRETEPVATKTEHSSDVEDAVIIEEDN